MARRRMFAHTRVMTPSQLGAERMAVLQEVCEFDLNGPSLDWARTTVLKHETHLRSIGLDGRQAAMGMRYSLQGNDVWKSLACDAYGHRADPVATHYDYKLRPGRDVSEFDRDEREWLDGVAMRHTQTERLLTAGGDPARPPSTMVVADPCLARMIRHLGLDVDGFLAAIPRHGQLVVGRGWRKVTPAPRTLEHHGLNVHHVRTGGRIEVVRLGIAPGIGYEPPRPDRSRLVGILYVSGTHLPDLVRTSLLGAPLSRVLDHPALDPDLRIRAISKSGGALAIRVEGCQPPRMMSESDPA